MNPATLAVVMALGLFGGMLLFLDLGYRLGRRAQREASWHERVGALEAAVYALLGLLLGFTFSGATSRFEAHRQLSVKEANAIGTAYLRLDELPQGSQPEMRQLFRDYLNARLEVQASLPDLRAAEPAMAQSTRLQKQIWSRALVASRSDPTQSSARLLLPAINELCTAVVAGDQRHDGRHDGASRRIPGSSSGTDFLPVDVYCTDERPAGGLWYGEEEEAQSAPHGSVRRVHLRDNLRSHGPGAPSLWAD